MDKEQELLKDIKEQFKAGDPKFAENCFEIMSLYNRKNGDYAKVGDPHGNFERVSQLKRIWPNMDWSSPVGVCIGYAFKQLDAGMSMLSNNYEGQIENVETRFQDVIVYFMIARLLHTREANKEQK
jgi:hypothetical protein